MGVHYVRGTPNGSPYSAGMIRCSVCELWFRRELAYDENRCPKCHQIARVGRRNKPKRRE